MDMVWHTSKLVYNITTGTYNWYYSINTPVLVILQIQFSYHQ